MRALARWGPVAAWCAASWLLSAQPADALPAPGWPYADKVAHFTLYAVLGLLLGRARLRPGWSLSLGGLWGIGDELHQRVVPGRTADPLDWLTDLAGLAVAAALYHFRRKEKHDALR